MSVNYVVTGESYIFLPSLISWSVWFPLISQVFSVSQNFILFFSLPGAVPGAAKQGPRDQVEPPSGAGLQDCEAEPGALL